MLFNVILTYAFLFDSTYPLHTDTGMKMNSADISSLVYQNYEKHEFSCYTVTMITTVGFGVFPPEFLKAFYQNTFQSMTRTKERVHEWIRRNKN